MPDPSADESTYEEIGYSRGEDATAANLNIDQQLESNVSMWSTDDEREAQEEENKLDEATGGASKWVMRHASETIISYILSSIDIVSNVIQSFGFLPTFFTTSV